MDLLHVPAGGILTDEFLRIIQLQLLCGLLFYVRLLLPERKFVRALMADRTLLQFRKRDAFRFLIINIAAYAASIFCHKPLSFRRREAALKSRKNGGSRSLARTGFVPPPFPPP